MGKEARRALASAAVAALCFLAFNSPAQATSDTPEIPPRQECVDILAASVPKMFSTYFYDGDGHYAAYQKTVDAGCLPRNPIYYYPDWDQWMDYDLCLDYERQVAAYMRGESTWAAPFYRQLMAIDRQAKKKLRPVRKKIRVLQFTKNKRGLKSLLRRERRQVNQVRRQLFALGGKTVDRGAANFAAGGLTLSDLFVRGCEIYQPFYYRQKNFYAAFWPSVLRWMRTYRGQITDRNWRDWHAMVQYNAYPSFVNVAHRKTRLSRSTKPTVFRESPRWAKPARTGSGNELPR